MHKLMGLAENETEVSFFNRELYEAFKQHPEVSLFVRRPLSFTEVLLQTKW